MMNTTNFSSWWGRHSIDANRALLWQIGPLQLWMQNRGSQIRMIWTHGPDWLDPRVRTVPAGGTDVPPVHAEEVTCIFGATGNDEVIFSPTLPNRSVVTRMAKPMRVMPGEETTLYVLSPLWLRIETANSNRLLHELPIFRFSDTWFGPMSSAGDLCYSSTSAAFLDLREVPLRLHCVISAVRIRNLGNDYLPLERVNIPLPRLSLFFSPRTGFWTDSITLERKDNTEMASIRLERQPPADANPSQFIIGPRQATAESNTVVRAFSAIFRERTIT
jgi:hypothetical protein